MTRTITTALFLLTVSAMTHGSDNRGQSTTTLDTALDENAKPVTVVEVDMRGKPPYKRRHKTLPAPQTSQLEAQTGAANEQTGRPPFKRH